jgi:hydrogenase 3 maturation protease
MHRCCDARLAVAHVFGRLYHSFMCEREGRESLTTLVLGVGNPLKGDDGVGPYVAERLATAHGAGLAAPLSGAVQAIDCGTTPENYTSVVRRLRPDVLVIVDAAEMGIGVGEFRIIPPDRVGTLGLSTHSMPLSLFMSYVDGLASRVVLVGVQPRGMVFGTGPSAEITAAGEALVSVLAEGRLGEVGLLD